MNPQNKAKELVSKYYNYVSAWTVTNLPNEAPEAIYEGKKMKIGRAKQCALICANEIIIQIESSTPKDDPYANLFAFDYWQEVKTEIEKM